MGIEGHVVYINAQNSIQPSLFQVVNKNTGND